MKTLTPFKAIKISLILISFLSISTPGFSDPYLEDCSSGNCLYIDAGSSHQACDVENLILYAVDTNDESINLTGATFDWFVWVRATEDNGWVEGWVNAIGGSANRFEVTDNDSYSYYCEVATTDDAWATSSVYVTYVSNNANIGNVPQDETVCPGDEVELFATGSGTAITNQWEVKSLGGDWQDVEGESANSYVFTAAMEDGGSLYRLRVSNICASVVSPSAELSIHDAPDITANISNATKCEGASAAYTISSTGSEISYKWQMSIDSGGNWYDISNGGKYLASDNNLSISELVHDMDQDLFKCQVTGICGFTTFSDSATLTVLQKPYLLRHPEDLTKCTGEQAILSARGGGTEPISYQWRKAGISVSETSTDTSFIIPEISMDHAGNYLVRLTNQCSSTPVPSDVADLMVNAVPEPNLGGEDIHLCPGDTVQLTADSEYAKYEWSSGDSTQKIKVSSQQTLELKVWNESGCSGKDEINIILDAPLPELNLGQDLFFCSGEEILLDASDQYDNYSWSNESREKNITVSTSGTYWVSAFRNSSECKVSDTLHIEFTEPYTNDNICLVTTDLETGDNLIVWEKTPDKGTAAYHILRQTSILNQYEIISTVPYDDLSIFRDTEVDPERQQWVYKIIALDTCGNISDVGDAIFHKPLFLQYQSSLDGVNLKWEEYEVENSNIEFESYEIYRGSDSINLSSLAVLSADLNAYSDKDPNALKFKYFYRVAGIKKNPCFPSAAKKADIASLDRSYSNMENNNLEPVVSVNPWKAVNPIEIYPNPMIDHATIRFNNPDNSEYKLVIRDFSGKLVKEIGSIRQREIQLNREDMVKGYYILELSGVKLFRGKLVVL